MLLPKIRLETSVLCPESPLLIFSKENVLIYTTKKDTSVTFWAERKKFCHAYDTSMTIIVTKPGIIIDVVGSYFYDKKS